MIVFISLPIDLPILTLYFLALSFIVVVVVVVVDE